jgi:hypothetical protein
MKFFTLFSAVIAHPNHHEALHAVIWEWVPAASAYADENLLQLE